MQTLSAGDNGSAVTRTSPRTRKELYLLALGALGVVYGDIGTSVLYAFRECFNPAHGVPLTDTNVFGVLSLIFWSLVLVVCLKYLSVVMRADNDGEGGIFALMARILTRDTSRSRVVRPSMVVWLGLCGTALLAADGIITPSISVLSAVEGLQIAAPRLRPAVIPITIAVLAALFLFQKRGTAVIGSWFGPLMLVWFSAIAILGVHWIARDPRVLLAVNPLHAFRFIIANRFLGIMVLGTVVLCVTGCEALYADLGHFGRRPMTLAWYWAVFPSVLLNYFGQGALVLSTRPREIGNPFFEIAPPLLIIPLVVLATAATIIASQALISGMFSLAKQAIQFDYLPRLRIVHTSETVHGQIYIPSINWILGIACMAMVLGFRDSSHMAAAYGIAVVGTMSITSLLMFAVEYEQWRWKLWQAVTVTSLFLVMDLAFLAGNLGKLFYGGWFTLAVGIGVLAVLLTWKRGIQTITRMELERAIPLKDFVVSLGGENIPRVKGTAAFILPYPEITPRALLHHLKHNKVLHEQVLFLQVIHEGIPVVQAWRRVEVQDLGKGFIKATVRTGFMQSTNIRDIRLHLETAGVRLDGEISYFIGHMSLRTSGKTPMGLWRKALFAFLFHNERSTSVFLDIPPNRVVELGEQTEI